MASYSVKLSGKVYQLPTKTLSIGKKLERFSEIPLLYDEKKIALEDVLSEQYDFVVESIGEENAASLIGSEMIEEMDIDELLFSVMAIVKAYTEKAIKAQIENQVAPYRTMMADKDIQKAVDIISKTK